MNFSQLFLIFRARYRIILSIFAITVLTTLLISVTQTKSYKATTSLIINYKGKDLITGISLPAQLMPGFMATQTDIITSNIVAGKVVDMLKLAEQPRTQERFQNATDGKGNIRDWLAKSILTRLDVQPSRESSVIEVSITDPDPEFAAAMANAFATAYQEVSLQLKTAPAQGAASYLGTQNKALRKELEVAQTKLSKYQQEKGITSGIEQFDAESAKLNALTQQMVIAQSQAIESSSRKYGIQGNAELSPDVASDPLVRMIKSEIVPKETKLADISQRFGQNHPEYLSIKAEVDKLRSQLQEASRNAAAGVGGSARINQQRESELRAQVAAQKTKVLSLNRARDQLLLLQKDVDNVQRSLEAVNQRFAQTSLEGQGNQTDVSVLNSAVAPLQPSSPNIKLNLLLSIFLGTILGAGFGLLVEMLNRRVRSAQDIQESLAIPVLGEIVRESKSLPHLRTLPQLRLGRV